MKPRFLLDEHINKAIQRQLRRINPNIEVLAIGDYGAPPFGASDPEILKWLEEKSHILVTENRSTMPNHISEYLALGHHFPGIFWVRPGTTLGQIIEELFLIWLSTEAEEFHDCGLYIPL